MKKAILILTGLLFTGATVAQELMIFPNEDQTPEKQEEEMFACYGWAKNETGFDPMAPPTATEAPPPEKKSSTSAGRGLVRGAAVGGIVDGSDGAKKGAAAGAVIGGARKRDAQRQNQQAQQQWEQEQQQIYADNRNRYNRAYAACLEGKGYTVR